MNQVIVLLQLTYYELYMMIIWRKILLCHIIKYRLGYVHAQYLSSRIHSKNVLTN